MEQLSGGALKPPTVNPHAQNTELLEQTIVELETALRDSIIREMDLKIESDVLRQVVSMWLAMKALIMIG